MTDLLPFLMAGKPQSYVTGLQPGFQNSLAAMFAAAPPDIRGGLHIMSGFRSPERQAEIMTDSLSKRVGPAAAQKWQQYINDAGGDVVAAGNAARDWLRSTGITKWVAPPGHSEHQGGNAVDLSYSSPGAVDWAHKNAPNFQLNFPLANENWHIEPAGIRSTIPGGPAMLTGSQGPLPNGEQHIPGGPAMLSSGATPAATAAAAPAAKAPAMNAAAYAALAGGGMGDALTKMGDSVAAPSGPDAQTLAAMFTPQGGQVQDTSQGGRLLAKGLAQGGTPGSLSDLFGQLGQQQQLLAAARQPQAPVGAGLV